ncbi:uncharacterized protein B0H64DRAFT_434941 [Chaetomium fimeti]|uniref:Uncharacterized protein n=1 Tax=Chaetomium fimeti TaxID=1854472 RepID=A0AAE0LPF6_9PEZI|nr:hypothetical protein B0H64DRAFT_434941 [Chaetomium fimeti]
MFRPEAETAASSGDDSRTTRPEALQQAVQDLGISHDQVTRLEDFIKRLLDEEAAGRGQCHIERIIAKYHAEWEAWQENPLEEMQAALRTCVIALRMGIPLPRLESPPSSPLGPPHAASDTQHPELNNPQPAPSAPPTGRDAQTQTDDLRFKEWLVENFRIMRVHGLGYETLEIQDVPTSKHAVVVVGDSPLSTLQARLKAEYGQPLGDDHDYDGGDGPIWGDGSLPIRAAVPSAPEADTEPHSSSSSN